MEEVGVEPMHGKNKFHTRSPLNLESIRRAFNSDAVSQDIAYFLGTSTKQVERIWNTIEEERNVAKMRIPGTNKYLHYRTASEIFMAEDLFKDETISVDELAELTDTHPQIVEYALENRDSYEPRIIELLTTLFPEVEITAPYMHEKPLVRRLSQRELQLFQLLIEKEPSGEFRPREEFLQMMREDGLSEKSLSHKLILLEEKIDDTYRVEKVKGKGYRIIAL